LEPGPQHETRIKVDRSGKASAENLPIGWLDCEVAETKVFVRLQ